MGMAAEDSIMSKNPDTNSADRDAEIEREIQTNRKFSLSEAIGRMAGGLMKGGSPVTRKRQAELEIDEYLRRHLVDSGGVLRSVLFRQLGESLLNGDYDQPLAALAEYIRRILTSEALLEEFVREADAEWGRVQNERPYFQRPSRPPHPDDPYTIDSVRSHYSNSARDSHRRRCRHTSTFLGEPQQRISSMLWVTLSRQGDP